MFMCVVNQISVNKLDLIWKQSFLIFVRSFGRILSNIQSDFRAKRKIVLDLRRTKSSDNLHNYDPTEITETEELATISASASAKNESEKKSKDETLKSVFVLSKVPSKVLEPQTLSSK
jgi:hypothetical protein